LYCEFYFTELDEWRPIRHNKEACDNAIKSTQTRIANIIFATGKHFMKSALNLRRRLRDNELTIGILVTNHFWLELLEISRYAGLDYIIIDLEHVNHGDILVADACRMGRMLDFPVIIRPARTDRESVRLAMDLGPCGLMLPMVQNTAQLDEVRDGIWMPPRGQRRPGGHGNWWVEDFNYSTWKEQVEDNFVIMTQIESPQGVANAEAIANHEITTTLAIGPYDLSARVGACWDPQNPALVEAIQKVRDAASAANKPIWMIGDGQALIDSGATFICIAEPANLLKATLKNMVGSLRTNNSAAQEKAFVP
jgi:2-keto-3-deoxy-L-rhamnonate aldolase RhmA